MYKHFFLALWLLVGLGPLVFVVLGEEFEWHSLSQQDLVDYSLIWVPIFGFTLWAYIASRKSPNKLAPALKTGALMAVVFLAGLFLFFTRIWPHV
jgi:hypothetical protein